MSHVVLVHGHYLGGWCWDDVRGMLSREGHSVLAPTLAGLGEREGEGGPASGIAVQTNELASLLDSIAGRVTIVGHSYAGLLVTGLLSRRPASISSAVYFDAVVPAHGETLLDQLPPGSDTHFRSIAAGNNGWSIPAPPVDALGIEDAALRARVSTRLTSVPLRTFDEPIDAPNAASWTGRRTYIRATQFPLSEPIAERLRRDANWRVHEIEAGHLAMLTHPRLVADLLLGAIPPETS